VSDSHVPDSVVADSVYPQIRISRKITSKTRQRSKVDDQLDPRRRADTGAHHWGVCLSGGGIRSASFSLGVLQEMHGHDMLYGEQKADYLSAVSGGAYMAGALTLIARGPFPGERVDRSPGATGWPDEQIETPDAAWPAFGAGTPEEGFLRNRTQYLTHGSGGIWAAAWRMVLGVVFNLALLGLAIHTLFRPVGWIYGAVWAHFRRNSSAAVVPCATTAGGKPCFGVVAVHTSLHIASAINLTAAGLGAAAVVCGLLWLMRRWVHQGVSATLGALSGIAVGAAILLAIFAIGIPHVLQFVLVDLPRHGIGQKVVSSTQSRSGQASSTLGRGFVATLIASVLAGIGAVRGVTSTNPAAKSVENAALSFSRRLWARNRMAVINLVAAIFGPLLVVIGALWCIALGAATPPATTGVHSGAELLRLAVPAAVLLLIWAFGDVTNWSLHPFYKRRLAAAFALRRIRPPRRAFSPTAVMDQEPDERLDIEERPNACPYPLSESQTDRTPTLLVCAAVNVSDYGASPTGSHVTPIVFSAEEIGGPVLGGMSMQLYEQRTQNRWRDTTLPAAMAMSGAAFSPSMGKMTRPPLRFLLALANLRLGVWLPNPRVVGAGIGLKQTNQTYGAKRTATDTPRPPATGAKPRYRYLSRPRPDYLLRELLGINRIDSRYLYITDGGHYENLGLVELLRRGCEWIWCIDASGDGLETFNTLGEAIALANAELGVQVAIEPEERLVPTVDEIKQRADQGKPPLAKGVCQRGTIYYHDPDREGTLIYIKAGVTSDAPWNVRSYQERNPRFPYDPTANQLYDAERFDAYRALGGFAMHNAWETYGRQFDAFRQQHHPGIDLRKPHTEISSVADTEEATHEPSEQ
jgi:hypothetical protein